ncbi:hypothetical protein LTR91_021262 [Friedmanniomyces endolithicus]|uniref:Histidine kinase n=1 Tax=Friedmanniomyces endolithicus TaxID=329885 RepID=A0AAN6H8B3_9PEZI|nr:hypothetical protein LTR35_009894 [Friedmanniomyces endolithicus]KAK0958593.1 hypothetical protein LTR91_021262 [Friedmanniomyces endolithicus]KAK1007380.1 hypothetical protein LTS01_002608 [Friedmanniomyces endolithicus]
MDDLPAELRGLVSYLAQDDRPSAILSDADEVAYCNASFEGLAISKHTLKTLLSQWRVPDRPVEKLCGIEGEDGRTWKRVHVLDGWTTLVCVGVHGHHAQHAATRTESAERSETKPAIPDTDGSLTPSKSQDFDWTKTEVLGLSPWTRYVRDFDWSTTPLGPMRQPAPVAWVEIYDPMRPYFEQAWQGNPVTLTELPVMMQREGAAIEEKFFDLSLLPIVGQHENERPAGVLDELVDVTQTVRGRRRRDSVRYVGQAIGSATSLKQLWPAFLIGLEPAVVDAPYAVIYSIQDDDSATHANTFEKNCILEGTVGIDADDGALPERFGLGMQLEACSGIIKACLRVWQSLEPIALHSADGSLPISLRRASLGRGFDDELRMAIVTPIMSAVADQEMLGILVIGLSPRSPYDEEYKLWTHIVSDLVRKTATLIILPEEQRRAQRIANELNDSLVHQLRITTLQAEQSEGKFRRMAESAPQGMYMFDSEGRTLHVNDKYLEILGETREHHSTRRPRSDDWKDQVHAEDLDRFLNMWNTIMGKKVPVTFEYRLKKPWKSIDDATGQELEGETWLLANAFPDIGTDGEILAVMGWLTDVSHRRMAEKLLAQRLNDALENKRQSENFIDMTSHEMRNPLSAILQSADSIVTAFTAMGMPLTGEGLNLSPEIADEIMEAAQIIVLCAQHQKRIVDDILTLSKLDASLLAISPEKVQLPSLLRKALKMYEGTLVHAGIDATLCVEPSYRELGVECVMLDASRLLQIIINLLTNAIKFTQYSEVRRITIKLGACLERPTGNHHKINFIPIRPGRQSPPVVQAEWGNGEDVYVQIAVSDTGEGLKEEELSSLFQRFSQASPKTYKQYGGSGLGLFISRELSELLGGQIGVASTAGNTTFAFFVKAKRCAQEAGGRRPSVPRVPSISDKPISYGRKGSIAPASPPEDHRQGTMSSDTLSFGTHATAGAELPIINGPKGKVPNGDATHAKSDVLHVLVVEDNMVNQRVMSQQLRRAGCVVHVANHGLECLGFLDHTIFCEATTPLSIILLDLEMPTMDGLTCIRHIRERQASGRINKHVPVIAVTANARSEQISVAIAAGMDQVVTKPFRIPELMPQMAALVAEIARLKHG